LTEEKRVVLDVEDLCKDFVLENGSRLSAVDHVSFQIREGECFAVIGESGCGKTTLAKLITRVEEATSGRVIFQDRDITALGRGKMKSVLRDMQMIFQNVLSVVSPKMKIQDFLLEPYRNFRLMPKREALENIRRMLKSVRLTEAVLKKYPHQLSGGELQRICISRAFGMNPQLLICDEITSALDVSVQDDVMKLFRELQSQHGIACLFICHDLALVSNYSDRIMVMYLGQNVEIIDSADLGTKALHPYTRGLLQSFLFISSDRGRAIRTISGEPQSPVDVSANCRFCTRCPKASSRCFEEVPPLREVGPGHYVACFLLE